MLIRAHHQWVKPYQFQWRQGITAAGCIPNESPWVRDQHPLGPSFFCQSCGPVLNAASLGWDWRSRAMVDLTTARVLWEVSNLIISFEKWCILIDNLGRRIWDFPSPWGLLGCGYWRVGTEQRREGVSGIQPEMESGAEGSQHQHQHQHQRRKPVTHALEDQKKVSGGHYAVCLSVCSLMTSR